MIHWRGDRVAEGARLESVCTHPGTEGSNPSLSELAPSVPALGPVQLPTAQPRQVRKEAAVSSKGRAAVSLTRAGGVLLTSWILK